MSHFWEATLFGTSVHLSTLIMVWLTMGAIVLWAASATKGMKVVPDKGQVFAESLYDFCRSITFATAGKRGDGYLFFIGSLFLFILVANLLGQLPLRLIPLPHGELIAATGDINTTAALAVLTLVMYFGVGIKRKGLAYFKHYISPSPFFLPLNLVEDITKPGSLMLRLYFNIMVGEILSGIALSMIPIGLPVLVIFLELFVAVIQAYIFSILSAVYIAIVSDEHH